MQLLLASRNGHKLHEIRQLVPGVRLLSLNDFPDIPDIEETGATFLENARLKAEALYRALRTPVLADDSGLEVPALDNRPGVLSRRYAGENASDKDRIAKLLEEMRGLALVRRRARFVCSMVLLLGRKEYQVCGFCDGLISSRPRGLGGFGYDPVFLLPDVNRTMAELSLEQKNSVSHRANALRKIKEILDTRYGL